MSEKSTVFIAKYSHDNEAIEEIVGVGTTYIKGLRILAVTRQWWRDNEWTVKKLPHNSDNPLFKYRVGKHSWRWINLELEEVELDVCI